MDYRTTLFTILLGMLTWSLFISAGCESANSPSDYGGDGDSDGDGDGDSDGDADGPHSLQTIEITPTNQILEVDLNTPTEQIFTATGHYADGVSEDLSDVVEWASDNAALGAFQADSPTLEIPGMAIAGADITKVSANYSGHEGLAQLTVVAYSKSGSQQDFFFLLPFEDLEGEQDKPLLFNTDVPALDVFFDMDHTGSMGGFITGLQTALTGTVIPGIEAEVDDSWFGVGRFEDFPISPYGGTSDQPFTLITEMTGDITTVQSGVSALSGPTGGADGPESIIESLYQIATGEGLPGPSPTNVLSNDTGVGGVGFREDSMAVVIPLTDNQSHTVDEGISSTDYTNASVVAVAHTREETMDALNLICAKVIGVASTLGDPDNIGFAEATGAVVPPEAWGEGTERPAGCSEGYCCTGISGAGRATNSEGLCPLAFLVSISGTGLDSSIVTGMQMLTQFATFDVETEVTGETESTEGIPVPSGYTTADFIKNIVPTSFEMPEEPDWLPEPTMTATGFEDITPGTDVNFQVYAYNDFVPPADVPQFFEATISVVAGGCTPLDDRVVLILVPANPIIVE